MTLTDLLRDYDDRDRAAPLAWMIDYLGLDVAAAWPDLAAAWPDLDDDGRDALVDAGIVEEVQGEVECAEAESWQSDWREESAAAWPTYTLRVTADGMEPLDVEGWHIVGYMGPDGNRSCCEWDTDDSDGACTGMPSVDDWTIRGGDNVGTCETIPCWQVDGQWYTLDREWLGDRYGHGALGDAAGDADHGSAPGWEDIDRGDMTADGGAYILQDYRVVEVGLLSGGIAGHEEEYETGYEGDYRIRTRIVYEVEAWSHDLTEDTFATRMDALNDLESMSEADQYEDEDEAKGALAKLARTRMDDHEPLSGYTYGVDEDGLYVEVDGSDGDDGAERYHLDEGELQSACQHGWYSVLDVIVDVFGTRASLAGLRQWQEDMDTLIDEDDPWVVLDDSVRSGNCPAGTRSFAAELERALHADGEIGAVRASVILSRRDDRYTRRACRMAAQRVSEVTK